MNVSETNKVASNINYTMSADHLKTPIVGNGKVKSPEAISVLRSSVSVPPEPLFWFTKFSKTLESAIASAVTNVLTN